MSAETDTSTNGLAWDDYDYAYVGMVIRSVGDGMFPSKIGTELRECQWCGAIVGDTDSHTKQHLRIQRHLAESAGFVSRRTDS